MTKSKFMLFPWNLKAKVSTAPSRSIVAAPGDAWYTPKRTLSATSLRGEQFFVLIEPSTMRCSDELRCANAREDEDGLVGPQGEGHVFREVQQAPVQLAVAHVLRPALRDFLKYIFLICPCQAIHHAMHG